MLVQECLDGNCRDEVLIADVGRAIRSSYELRNKRDLIERFIDSLDQLRRRRGGLARLRHQEARDGAVRDYR